jgi:predicted MFS family arabinose efflux permease
VYRRDGGAFPDGPIRFSPRIRKRNFDALGAVLATAGPMLLVYALVRAPSVGWSTARTIGELGGAAVILAAFAVNELRHRNPLAPLSIFRINALGFANITQLTAFAGFLGLFFFLTLYLQEVLGYSPVKTGLAYLPLCEVIAVSAGISSQLLSRIGTRPVIIAGAAHTQHLLASHLPRAQALTSGFHLPLLLGSIFILAAAVIALRATNTRGETAKADAHAEGVIQPGTASSEPALTGHR